MNKDLQRELGLLCAQFAAETKELVNRDQHTIGGFWMWKEAELLSHMRDTIMKHSEEPYDAEELLTIGLIMGATIRDTIDDVRPEENEE
jgi:hypothetical protein